MTTDRHSRIAQRQLRRDVLRHAVASLEPARLGPEAEELEPADDARDLDDLDVTSLLANLEDDDLDDDAASELTDHLDLLPRVPGEEENDEGLLDIAITVPDLEEGDDDDDTTLQADAFDLPVAAWSDDGGAAEREGDDAEGAVEPLHALVDRELPPLDRADADELGPGGGQQWAELPHGAAALPAVDDRQRWTTLDLALPAPACATLFQHDASVFGAGRSVVELRAGIPAPASTVSAALRRLGPLPSTARSVVAATMAPERVLCCTATGELLELDLQRVQIHRRTGWRATAGVPPHRVVELSLGHSGAAPVLALSSGQVLFAAPGDDQWTLSSLEGPVLALSRGAPSIAVTAEGGQVLLQAIGRTRPERRRLGSVPAMGSPTDDEWLVASGGVLIAVGTRRGALALSVDGGESFSSPIQTAELSALCAGSLAGAPCAFAAASQAATDRAQLLAIPAGGEPLLIGEITATPTEDEAEPYRVDDLLWEDDGARLWCAGPFGVRLWTRDGDG